MSRASDLRTVTKIQFQSLSQFFHTQYLFQVQYQVLVLEVSSSQHSFLSKDPKLLIISTRRSTVVEVLDKLCYCYVDRTFERSDYHRFHHFDVIKPHSTYVTVELSYCFTVGSTPRISM